MELNCHRRLQSNEAVATSTADSMATNLPRCFPLCPQVLDMFREVWGAGEASCSKWYAAGCRTLDDVRARDDLTQQQKVRQAAWLTLS
jgi:hypothetical protein